MVTREACWDWMSLAAQLIGSAGLGQERVNTLSGGANGKVVLSSFSARSIGFNGITGVFLCMWQ